MHLRWMQLQVNVLWSLAVERCMSVMQSGTQMIKLKRGTKGLVRLFYLDEHRTRLRWRPSRKSEKAKSKLNLWILCFIWQNSFAWKYMGSAEQALWELHICRIVKFWGQLIIKTINGNESKSMKAFLSINAKMLIIPLCWRYIVFSFSLGFHVSELETLSCKM